MTFSILVLVLCDGFSGIMGSDRHLRSKSCIKLLVKLIAFCEKE